MIGFFMQGEINKMINENKNFDSSFEIDESTKHDEEKLKKKAKLVRSDFKTVGQYDMPLIRKQRINLDKIELWGYPKAKSEDSENRHKTIHFFTHDWKFDAVYDKPEVAMEKLDQYYALLTPDFSMYWDMPRALQINSTFKNRWCGAYWQHQGKIVIPTVSCAGESSYDFCFDGIEIGSVVAVSTYCREDYEKEFLRSYNKMLEVLKPSAIVCYGEPFSEMRGNIKVISPFNHEELIKKMGLSEYTRKYFAGELYPSN